MSTSELRTRLGRFAEPPALLRVPAEALLTSPVFLILGAMSFGRAKRNAMRTRSTPIAHPPPPWVHCSPRPDIPGCSDSQERPMSLVGEVGKG